MSPGPFARASRSGVLVVDKADGITSFAVVAMARRALGVRRIGHAGTLDPGATGVLPLLVGEATKLMPYLVNQDKEYVAVVRLGVTTDTYDLAGRVVATAAVPVLDRAALEAAVQPFVGRIRQVPPMYSAVHHGGRRLYELAREGIEVAREAREVVIHAIDILDIGPDAVTLRVTCGKGTYVRTLAADLGQRLGCGAAVERLTRRRVGPFGLDGAVPSAVLVPAKRGELLERLLPPEAALAGWPVVRLGERAAASFGHGQPVALPRRLHPDPALVAVHTADDRLLGVGELTGGGTHVRPARILHADHQGHRVHPA